MKSGVITRRTDPGDEPALHVQAQQRVVHHEQRQAVARRHGQVGRHPERERHRVRRQQPLCTGVTRVALAAPLASRPHGRFVCL